MVAIPVDPKYEFIVNGLNMMRELGTIRNFVRNGFATTFFADLGFWGTHRVIRFQAQLGLRSLSLKPGSFLSMPFLASHASVASATTGLIQLRFQYDNFRRMFKPRPDRARMLFSFRRISGCVTFVTPLGHLGLTCYISATRSYSCQVRFTSRFRLTSGWTNTLSLLYSTSPAYPSELYIGTKLVGTCPTPSAWSMSLAAPTVSVFQANNMWEYQPMSGHIYQMRGMVGSYASLQAIVRGEIVSDALETYFDNSTDTNTNTNATSASGDAPGAEPDPDRVELELAQEMEIDTALAQAQYVDGEWVSDAFDEVKDFGSKALDQAKDLGTAAVDGLGQAVDKAKQTLSNIHSRIKDFVWQARQKFEEWRISRIRSAMLPPLKTAWRNCESIMNGDAVEGMRCLLTVTSNGQPYSVARDVFTLGCSRPNCEIYFDEASPKDESDSFWFTYRPNYPRKFNSENVGNPDRFTDLATITDGFSIGQASFGIKYTPDPEATAAPAFVEVSDVMRYRLRQSCCVSVAVAYAAPTGDVF
eukprot:TRINITY_DN463_c0_g1_i5.p1 TRINITY_DN463_c0_g1~~TRINITY_DN463_c0_g1_i5.p1  ORF type:complete len:530 (-),score=225.58 TRINITY_DN463_c0_g1_i5:223-1812(-)